VDHSIYPQAAERIHEPPIHACMRARARARVCVCVCVCVLYRILVLSDKCHVTSSRLTNLINVANSTGRPHARRRVRSSYISTFVLTLSTQDARNGLGRKLMYYLVEKGHYSP